jgi:glycine cleavage system H protein
MVAIFVILMIVAFIVIDSVVQWSETKKRQNAGELAAQPRPPVLAFAFERISLPQGIFVDTGHTWVSVDASGNTHVGMDDFVQQVVGRIDAVELPEAGQEVRRGERLFAVRQGERTAVFTAPIDGVINCVNENLIGHPDAIKADPYKQGWVCGLIPKNLAKNLKRLSIAEDAMAWFGKEIERFQEFFAARPVQTMALGQVLQDGGQPTGGVLELMDDETWNLFTREFLVSSETEEKAE